MHVRVYNYNTLERVHQFEAHSDYLRSIAVHPTQPYILTSSGNISKMFYLLSYSFLVHHSEVILCWIGVLRNIHLFQMIC